LGVDVWPTPTRINGASDPLAITTLVLLEAELVRIVERRSALDQVDLDHSTLREAIDTLNASNRINEYCTFVVLSDAQRWVRMQDALSISLSDLIAKQSGETMLVSPVFGLPNRRGRPTATPSDVLVLMPFSDDMNEVYDEIRGTALRCGATVARADDFVGRGVVIRDVWTAICSAKLIIADCTHRSPNVFYEIGLAHAIGTPVLLLTQDPSDAPFDVRHERLIQYSPARMRDFRVALEVNIRYQLRQTSSP
jgi:hypothetical protein